jgi:DNA-binding transcriptional LysR family regulator
MRNSRISRYLRHGTLTQLRAFEAVARHGNFTRAAEELHMAQPTVSAQMRKLAVTVGSPLLEQVGKRVHPTAAGIALSAACGEIVTALERFEQTLSDLRQLRAGTLRIAADTTVKYMVPCMLAEFARRHPGIEASLQVLRSDALLERLAQDADDLYLLTDPPQRDGIVVHPILPNPFVVLARCDHPLARAKSIPFARLAGEPLLVREDGSATRAVTNRLLVQRGVEPKVCVELGSNEAIMEAIVAGMGVAVLARYSIGLRLDRHELVELDVEGFPLELYWYAAYPAGKHLSPPAAAFIDMLKCDASALLATTNRPDAAGRRVDRGRSGRASAGRRVVQPTPDDT